MPATAQQTEDTLAKTIMQRQGELERIRQPYEPLQQTACEMTNYRREVWNANETKGEKRGKLAYDGTPASARKIWSDGMQGYLVSRAIKWFMLKMANWALMEYPEVKEWLQRVEIAMYHAFHRSNFYSELSPYFDDAGASGTAVMYGEEDVYKENTVFSTHHPKQVWIAENKYGRVDTVHRKFKITARQAAQKFESDIKNLSDNLQQIIREGKSLGQEFEFIHAVYPNSDKTLGKPYRGSEGFTSYYVQTQNEKVIRRRQWDWMRYATWRTRKYSGDVYGYSPAMEAIIEIEKLNDMAKTMLVAGQRAVDPVWWIPQDMKGSFSKKPGAKNYYSDPSQEVKTIPDRVNYPLGVDQMDRAIKIIERFYHVDLFLLMQKIQDRGQRTAYEISKLVSEQAVLLGSEIGRLSEDALDPIIDLVFDIEYRAGRIPEPPQIILDAGQGELEVDYIGPLSQAQKRLFENMNIEEAIIAARPILEIFPETKDIMKGDEAMRQVLESSGWPQKAISTKREVKDIRAARAEQMRQMQAQEAMAQAADAVPKLQKSNEPGSPMDEINKAMAGVYPEGIPGAGAAA